jgi:hypothetical protein
MYWLVNPQRLAQGLQEISGRLASLQWRVGWLDADGGYRGPRLSRFRSTASFNLNKLLSDVRRLDVALTQAPFDRPRCEQ